MKKTVLTFLTFFPLLSVFAQMNVVEEKVISCSIQPNIICLSPDGSTLIVGGNGKKLRVYDAYLGSERTTVTVKDVFTIYDIQFAPDGRSFAAAGDDYIVIFDTRTFETLFDFKAGSGNVKSISYSPDSKKLIGVYKNRASIIDLTTWKYTFLGDSDYEFTKVEWCSSQSIIAFADDHERITIWNISENSKKLLIQSPKEQITGIGFYQYENRLLTASTVGVINIYDILTRDNIKRLTFNEHYPRFVFNLSQFDCLISGGEDGRLIQWSLSDYKPDVLVQYPDDRLLSYSVAPEKNKLAVGLSNKSVHILTVSNYGLPMLKRIVSKKTLSWQQQGKYEKSSEFVKRVTDSARIKQIDIFTQQVIDSLGQTGKKWVLESTEYDADNETFKLHFKDYPSILVNVPLKEAESFDGSSKQLQFTNPKFTVENNAFVLMHIEITNPANQKSYSYDKREAMAFNPDKLALNFDPINLTLPKTENGANASTRQPASLVESRPSDIDQELPVGTNNYKDAYVLIIGNEDYTKYNSNLSPESNVPYARNDARSFYNYAINILNIPSENVFFFTDAIGSVMKREVEKLCKLANLKEGKIDLIFYYAGHGLPDDKTKEAFILPVDISSENLNEGIKLADLYQKFSVSKAHRTVVIVDACFSGEGRNQSLLAARAIRMKPQEVTLEGNIVVMTAVKSDQRSLPYNLQRHGIFTYYLLKYLKETNGSATLGDLDHYLCEEVSVTSLKLCGIEQTPQIVAGNGVDKKWKEWILKK